MANQHLYDSATYQLPTRILDGIRQALLRYPTGEATKRANGLLQDPALTYSALKRIKSDLEAAGAAGTPAYELAGGAPMLAWANQQLTQDRQQVHRGQTTRSNAGLENQFIKSHEKSHHAPSVAPAGPSRATDPVRRQQLNEGALDPPPYRGLAAALLGLFPELSMSTNHRGELVLTSNILTVLVRASVL
jgi:hypothetical protein